MIETYETNEGITVARVLFWCFINVIWYFHCFTAFGCGTRVLL